MEPNTLSTRRFTYFRQSDEDSIICDCKRVFSPGAFEAHIRTCKKAALVSNKQSRANSSQAASVNVSAKRATTVSSFIPCPKCSGNFLQQFVMVDHYNSKHEPCVMQTDTFPNMDALLNFLEELNGQCGIEMVCTLQSLVKRNYTCAVQCKSDMRALHHSCTAFLNATIKDGGIDVVFCTHHSHAIEKNYIRLPLAATLIAKNEALSNPPSVWSDYETIAQMIRDSALKIPLNMQNYNYQAMKTMTAAQVQDYLSGRYQVKDIAQNVNPDEYDEDIIPMKGDEDKLPMNGDEDDVPSKEDEPSTSYQGVPRIKKGTPDDEKKIQECDIMDVEYWEKVLADLQEMEKAPPAVQNKLNLNGIHRQMSRITYFINLARLNFEHAERQMARTPFVTRKRPISSNDEK